MPHICAIPLDSSVLQALHQTRRQIGPQRERRGLERPRKRRLAPERFAWKRRQTCQQHHAEHDQETRERAQQRAQTLRQEACDLPPEKRRQYEPADPHSERDHLARQAVEQADRDRYDQDAQYAEIEPSHRCATCPTSRPSDLSLSRAFSAAPRLANGPARTRVCSPCWPLTLSV